MRHGADCAERSYRQSSRGEFGVRLVYPIHRSLAFQPRGQLSQSFFERYTRLIPEYLSRKRYICETMTDVAHPVLTHYLRPHSFLPQGFSHLCSDVPHAIGTPAANVEDLSVSRRPLERQTARSLDIVHTYKITKLAAILKNHRSFIIQQSRGKNCQYTGVRI